MTEVEILRHNDGTVDDVLMNGKPLAGPLILAEISESTRNQVSGSPAERLIGQCFVWQHVSGKKWKMAHCELSADMEDLDVLEVL